MPRLKVLDGTGSGALPEPIGDEQGKIEAARGQALIRNGLLMELFDPKGNQFDPDSGIQRFEEVSFLLKCVFEVRIVAECDAERGHRSSGCIPNDGQKLGLRDNRSIQVHATLSNSKR